MDDLLTPEEARRAFEHRGESQAAWARRHGVSKVLLCNILHGKRKCLRGESHRIAVLLGIKRGEIFLPKPLAIARIK
jgi:gp16 family phage-associated protein